MSITDKGLRAADLGVRAGYLIAFGVVGFLIWKFLKSKGAEVRTVPPAIGPSAPSDPTYPENQSDSQGIVIGNAQTAITAQIISPPDGGSVDRNLLKTTFDVEIELASSSMSGKNVDLEVLCDFYEWAGAERLGIRTHLGSFYVAPGEVKRVKAEVDSGNRDLWYLEFGQANAIVKLLLNGVSAQVTSFSVT